MQSEVIETCNKCMILKLPYIFSTESCISAHSLNVGLPLYARFLSARQVEVFSFQRSATLADQVVCAGAINIIVPDDINVSAVVTLSK